MKAFLIIAAIIQQIQINELLIESASKDGNELAPKSSSSAKFYSKLSNNSFCGNCDKNLQDIINKGLLQNVAMVHDLCSYIIDEIDTFYNHTGLWLVHAQDIFVSPIHSSWETIANGDLPQLHSNHGCCYISKTFYILIVRYDNITVEFFEYESASKRDNELVPKSSSYTKIRPKLRNDSYDSNCDKSLQDIIDKGLSKNFTTKGKLCKYIIDEVYASVNKTGFWVVHTQDVTYYPQFSCWQSITNGDLFSSHSNHGCYYYSDTTYIFILRYQNTILKNFTYQHDK